MRPRVLSGMRPTGAMHLGHYHGALKNWVRLQDEYDCFYLRRRLARADHALRRAAKCSASTCTRWSPTGWPPGWTPSAARSSCKAACPNTPSCSRLLAMGTPLGWLERVPTYKDQIDKLKDRDLATYGFLGYPLLQAADILIYKAAFVPVGEDQASHVELTREVARRFNHLYGRASNFEAHGGGHPGQAEQGRRALLRQAAPRLRRNRQCRGGRQGRGAVAPLCRCDRRLDGRRQRAAAGPPARRRQDHPHRAAGAAHRSHQAARAWTAPR